MRPYLLALGAIVVVTLVGLVALWPGETETDVRSGVAGETEDGEVVSVEQAPCPGAPPGQPSCLSASVRVLSGPDEGRTVTVELGAGGIVPELDPGDQVRLNRSAVLAPPVPPATGGSGGTKTPPESSAGVPSTYSFADFERGRPMLVLALAFAVLVVAFGRLRGALSLVGLALSLLVVLAFIVPAILDGTSPLLVAVVGALTVMLVTISLAHGVGPKSLAAMLGTAISLMLVALLALLATEATHLTGLASEEAAILSLEDGALSFDGLLLAGMVVGALGVLDDVTVSQASTVLALRAANPGLSARELHRRAIAVGRDHVSATVNTLVLAYVGASLPVLLIFSSSQIGVLDAVNTELVAKEVVATLVGSIGLIAAVPLTTAIAARLSVALPTDRLADSVDHAH